MNTKPQYRILLVYNEPRSYVDLMAILQEANYLILTSAFGTEGESGVLTLVSQEQPDLILIHLASPSGISSRAKQPGTSVQPEFALCRSIKADKQLKDVPVIIVANQSSEIDVRTGFQAGIHDYIEMSKAAEELLIRINAHILNRRHLKDLEDELEQLHQQFNIARRQQLEGQKSSPRWNASDQQSLAGSIYQLTDREVRVLSLYAAGHGRQDIATDLEISENTVRWYIKNIYSKLGISSKVEAVAEARGMGL